MEGQAPQPGYGHRILTGDRPVAAPSPEQLEHIYRLSDPSLSELELEELLEKLLERVQDALAADTVAFLLLDPGRDELLARAAKGIEEEVEQGVRIPLGRGFGGRIAAERVPIFIPDVNHADVLNPILREKGIRSLLGVPLISQGDLVGVLHVGSLTPREFGYEDVALLELAAARAAPAIERARLFDALEREHATAVGLQRSLLPHRLPDVIGATLAARYLPARDEVGGDWYDVIPLARGQLGITIGDIAGHGVRAASLMGQLRTAVHAYALEGHPPGDVLVRSDRVMQTMRERGMSTAAYGVFDPESGRLIMASAAHPPPVLIRNEGGAEIVEVESGPPLGAGRQSSFAETTIHVGPGDTILLYTDGLIERRGRRLSEGLAELVQVAQGNGAPERLCQRVLSTLAPAGGGDDDVALLAVQNAPLPEVLAARYPADPAALAASRVVLRRWLRDRGVPEDEIPAIVLAAGEACANAVEHAYSPELASFELRARIEEDSVILGVQDSGRWRPPRGENRGRGLLIMERAMDEFEVRPTAGGTEVVMRRKVRAA